MYQIAYIGRWETLPETAAAICDHDTPKLEALLQGCLLYTSSYKKRNYYMVDHAEYLIGVFDNQKKLRSGTAQTVNYALHQGKVITLIHPDTMEITCLLYTSP